MDKNIKTDNSNVKIAIMGRQTGPEGETSTSRTISPGFFTETDIKKEIFFTEKGGSDEEVKTRILYDENMVEIIRDGASSSHMIFEPGKANMTKYRTSFGTLLLGVSTKKLEFYTERGKTTIRLTYELLDNTGIISTNETVISIRF